MDDEFEDEFEQQLPVRPSRSERRSQRVAQHRAPEGARIPLPAFGTRGASSLVSRSSVIGDEYHPVEEDYDEIYAEGYQPVPTSAADLSQPLLQSHAQSRQQRQLQFSPQLRRVPTPPPPPRRHSQSSVLSPPAGTS
eukprot:4443351-Amphidinium_carterae.1